MLNELCKNKTLSFPSSPSSLISDQRREIARIVPIALHPAFIQASLHKSNFPFDQEEKWLFVFWGFDAVFKMCNHGGAALWKPHTRSRRRVLIFPFSLKNLSQLTYS